MMEHDSYGGRAIHKVYNQDFIIDKRFKVTKEIGHGAYGIVCSAKYIDENDQESSNVAIKKVTNIFSKKILCKRSLRELKLLEFFRGHKNITCLYDLDIVPNPMTGDFNEVYLYEELMECDMHQIIRSGQPLTDEHFQFFIYQTLCGLKYIHSADVLHRDLKPSNLLVNADCNVKICDFGLARGFSENPEQNAGFLTEYVATRWYRAPEIMLSFTNYTKAIDIWSVGCILAELLGGKPLFRGKDYVDQLNQILLVLGTPKESTLTKIGSVRAQNYVRSLPIMRKVPFSELFPNANPLALDLLEKMLTLDPHQRITTEEALKHPYLSIWRVPADEPECKVKFDFKSFESIDDVREMKEIIIDDVRRFRDFVRRPIEEQQQIKLQYELQSNEKQWHRDTGNKFSNGLDNVPSFQGVRSDLSSAAINPNSPFLPSQPNNETSGLINMDESNADFEHDIQYYQSIPKPQEIDEFSFFKRDDRGKESISSSNVSGLFQLEEELNFGLDGNNLYHNV